MLKIMMLTLIASASFTTIKWEPNLAIAKAKARAENKLVLLNFSGSDWCGPCIRLKKEILETAEFACVADTALFLVNADFPRLSKNKLDKARVSENEALAEKYNPDGEFPLTLLLDTDGKVLKKWPGLPKLTPVEFGQEIMRFYQSLPQ
jgi:thiol-disulfide isomerase/thioredoxin